MSKSIPGHEPTYLIYLLHIMSKVQTFDHKEVFDVSSHALQRHALAIMESNPPNKIPFSLTSKDRKQWLLTPECTLTNPIHTSSWLEAVAWGQGILGNNAFCWGGKSIAPMWVSLVIPPHEEHAPSSTPNSPYMELQFIHTSYLLWWWYF
jgi:hypothetical protein